MIKQKNLKNDFSAPNKLNYKTSIYKFQVSALVGFLSKNNRFIWFIIGIDMKNILKEFDFETVIKLSSFIF